MFRKERVPSRLNLVSLLIHEFQPHFVHRGRSKMERDMTIVVPIYRSTRKELIGPEFPRPI